MAGLPNNLLRLTDVYRLLRKACERAGGQAAWARQHQISETYVCDVMQARRSPGPSVLKALGLRAQIVYAIEKDIDL